MLRRGEMWESQTTCRGRWDVRPTSHQPGESMRAKELVPILAEIYGVPFETAFMIDRSLAERGLRAKGRGKSIPQMTRREAVTFLLACMVNQRTTRAADDLEPWLTADGYLDDEPLHHSYFEEAEALGLVGEGEPDEDYLSDELRAHNPTVRRILDSMGYEPIDGEGFPVRFGMIDFLMAACDFLEDHPTHADDLRLEVSLSHGWATLTWPGLNQLVSRIRFSTHDNDLVFDQDSQISRSASIGGIALLALTVRTSTREEVD